MQQTKNIDIWLMAVSLKGLSVSWALAWPSSGPKLFGTWHYGSGFIKSLQGFSHGELYCRNSRLTHHTTARTGVPRRTQGAREGVPRAPWAPLAPWCPLGPLVLAPWPPGPPGSLAPWASWLPDPLGPLVPPGAPWAPWVPLGPMGSPGPLLFLYWPLRLGSQEAHVHCGSTSLGAPILSGGFGLAIV